MQVYQRWVQDVVSCRASISKAAGISALGAGCGKLRIINQIGYDVEYEEEVEDEEEEQEEQEEEGEEEED